MREPIPSIRRVLIADDDELTLSAFRAYLPRHGVAALTATNRDAALDLARKHRPDAGIIDLHLGCENGLDLLHDLRIEHPSIRLILYTGHSSVQVAVEAMRLGASDVLPKPCSCAEILRRIDPQWQTRAREPIVTPSADRALWEHVHRVLADCGGNKSEASRRLRKPRSWLRRFLARRAPRN